MSFSFHHRVVLIFIVVLVVDVSAFAQSGSSSLRGQVTDPSGAAITDATVIATTPDGHTLTTRTNKDGMYEFKGLTPGKYSLHIYAKGFNEQVSDAVEVASEQAQKLNFTLEIAVIQEKVEVNTEAPTVDTTPSNNASSIVISGKELEALSDDPDDLQQDLEALAGPSAGPNGGQMYIDGFTAGQLPPKASIREIRINQNPFSPEYDKLGYGRIEVFTKPGTDKLHGQLMVNGNTAAFNALNPYLNVNNSAGAPNELPSYYSTIFDGSVGGPISKRASFFVDVQRRNINDESVVSALNPDPTLTTAVPFSEALPNSRTRTEVSPRIDFQVTKNNTLTGRYQLWRDTGNNQGVGQLSLATQAYNSTSTEHQVQISDTQVFGAKIVNETRFQYVHEGSDQTPVSTNPMIVVPGAFTSGGSGQSHQTDHTNRFELQNYTSLVAGNHIWKFGGRLRTYGDQNTSTANFNGSYTFPFLSQYQAAEQAIAAGQPIPVADLPSQFTLTATGASGSPTVSTTVVDAGLYVGDDWKVRPNVTLSYGLRFETQNEIHDHGDWAPRIAVAWGLGRKGSSPKTVLRAGFGMFYDRFTTDLVLQSLRLNGVTQQKYVVSAPQTTFYPTVPPPSSLPPTTAPTVYQIDPNLHAPYTMQSAISVERQLSKTANLAVSYLHSRGVHALLSRNINAPLPGTNDPNNPANRPLGTLENIYQYESEGTFKQNQLIVNANVRMGTKLSLFGYYTLNYANSNTAGANSFPSNQYNIDQDYGRAAFDTRHRLFLGGSVGLPYLIRLSPFLIASSGSPFNITTGTDLNGDSIYNDRPSFASSLSNPADVHVTKYGTFNAVPVAGETIIPINYGTGPGRFTMNLRVGKTIGFGKVAERAGAGSGAFGGGPGGERHGGGGGFGRAQGGGGMMMGSSSNHRYNLTLSVTARNLFNNVNRNNPIGNLSSPAFGISNGLAGGPFQSASASAANRRIDLQALFTF
jgi:hypothetical protein